MTSDRVCATKRVYPSDADAKRAIARIRYLKPDLPALHYYRCPVCHRFHLTKMAQPGSVGRVKR